MKSTNISELINKHKGNALEILRELRGLYICPKDPKTGKRLGKIVGYAANYKNDDGTEEQWCGDIFVNWAVAEQYPTLMNFFAKKMVQKIPIPMLSKGEIVFVGPEKGGIAIAILMALNVGITTARYACAEKKTSKEATATMREQTGFMFSRHSIRKNDRVFVTEDVLNNFSTTDKTIELIESFGATVVGINGILNRSPKYNKEYVYGNRKIPIFALVTEPYPEYKQHDLEVMEDIVNGNVALKPKDEWPALMESMKKAEQIV